MSVRCPSVRTFFHFISGCFESLILTLTSWEVLFKMQAAYEELNSKAHANNQKRHDLAISLNFMSQRRSSTAMELKFFLGKCQFEIEKKRKEIKILEFHSLCILIGLFAFWPYTVGSFLMCVISISQRAKLESSSVQLVNASYETILHIEMIRIFFMRFFSFLQQFKSFIMHSIHPLPLCLYVLFPISTFCLHKSPQASQSWKLLFLNECKRW